MSPPNTVNELKVAKPTCALEPTAIAEVPTITLGAYSTDSTAKLNWPNTESVMPNSSCIVDQCTMELAGNNTRITVPTTLGRQQMIWLSVPGTN